MMERDRCMMRIILLNKYVTIETTHFRNSEYADGAEGSCPYRKDLTLCNISTELCICGALQPEDCSFEDCTE